MWKILYALCMKLIVWLNACADVSYGWYNYKGNMVSMWLIKWKQDDHACHVILLVIFHSQWSILCMFWGLVTRQGWDDGFSLY